MVTEAALPYVEPGPLERLHPNQRRPGIGRRFAARA